MSDFLYIIGAPASGKSTLVKALTAEAEALPARNPLAHIIWLGGAGDLVTEIGAEREAFRGTDALPMDAQRKALPWVATKPATCMLAEGDRLANMGFFGAVRDAGYTLTVVHLCPPEDIIKDRRQLRERELGKAQNPTWLKGRETKVQRLAEESRALPLAFPDTEAQLAFLAGHPVVEALR